MLIPKKHKSFKSKKHLEYVSNQNCCLDFRNECGGGVQAHHLLKPWNGIRGMSIKSNDKNTIPLCYWHHKILHDEIGDEYKFFRQNKLPPNFGKMVAVFLWINSPIYEEYK